MAEIKILHHETTSLSTSAMTASTLASAASARSARRVCLIVAANIVSVYVMARMAIKSTAFTIAPAGRASKWSG